MASQRDHPNDTSIGDLFHKLVEDGRNVVRTEVDLYRKVAAHRAGKAKTGFVALVAAAVLGLGGLIVLLVMLAHQIAEWLDSYLLSGVILGGLLFVAAFLLARYGAAKVSALGGDEEERLAIQKGELG